MTNLGQIVYKYYNQNKIWYTDTNGNLTNINIEDFNTENIFGWDPSTNLLGSEGILKNCTITKLGIQAPQGSVLVLNDQNSFFIGSSGILELEENISSLYFDPKPESNVILDFIYTEQEEVELNV